MEYLKGLRKIDLEGVSHRVEEKKQQDKQKEHDTIMKTVKEQDLARLKAATFNEREQRRKNNELDYYGREMTRFAKDHQERDAIEAKHKADREAKAMETLKQIRAKEEAQQKAAKAFAKKSKLQLAQETKKQHVHEEKKQAKWVLLGMMRSLQRLVLVLVRRWRLLPRRSAALKHWHRQQELSIRAPCAKC